MGERACRWSGKRSGQSLGQQTVRRPRDRRAASSRLHARAAARASLATHSTLAFYVAGAATAVCSRQLCGGVAHFGSAERQRAVVELRKVGCKCPNAMTFIPHSRNKYLMSVFSCVVVRISAPTGAFLCTAHPRTLRPPQVQPRGSLLRAGACQRPTHESPSGRCRVAAPPATQRGKAGMQIAGRAGCLLQQHMRTVSASFGRLRIQPSGRSCRRACVA